MPIISPSIWREPRTRRRTRNTIWTGWWILKTTGLGGRLYKTLTGIVNVRREERRGRTLREECDEEQVGEDWTPRICRNEPAGPSSRRLACCCSWACCLSASLSAWLPLLTRWVSQITLISMCRYLQHFCVTCEAMPTVTGTDRSSSLGMHKFTRHSTVRQNIQHSRFGEHCFISVLVLCFVPSGHSHFVNMHSSTIIRLYEGLHITFLSEEFLQFSSVCITWKYLNDFVAHLGYIYIKYNSTQAYFTRKYYGIKPRELFTNSCVVQAVLRWDTALYP